MADKKLNIKLGLKGGKKTEQQLGRVDKRISSMGKSALKAGAAFFAVSGIIRGFNKVIELAGEQELQEKKLSAQLGKTSTALLNQAKALQQVTRFGDESIIGVQAAIAAFDKNEEHVAKATEATLDFAAAMGFDLKSAGDLVAKTLGSSTNALTRYGVEVTGAVGSTERLESLTRGVAELWGGQASAQADTMTGSIDQMKNAVSDAGEDIGNLFAPVVVSIAGSLKDAATAASDFFQRSTETSLETTIRELQGLGISTLNLELAFSKATAAKSEFQAVGLRDEAEISKNLENSLNLRVSLLKDQGRLQAKLLEQGTSEKDLLQIIAGANLAISGASSGRMADQKVMAMQSKREAEAKLSEITINREILENLQQQTEVDQADLEIIQKSKAAKEAVKSLELAIEESKKNQVDLGQEIATQAEETTKPAEINAEAMEKMAQFAAQTSASLLTSAVMGDNLKESLKRAIIQMLIMVAQAKLQAFFMEKARDAQESIATGGASTLIRGAAKVANFLFGHEGGKVTNQGIQKFHSGGLASDEVPAILQQGEAVLRRSAVDRLGVQAVSALNRGESPGNITVNITAPLVDETVVDSIIPAIERAVRMGLA